MPLRNYIDFYRRRKQTGRRYFIINFDRPIMLQIKTFCALSGVFTKVIGALQAINSWMKTICIKSRLRAMTTFIVRSFYPMSERASVLSFHKKNNVVRF